MKQKYGMILIVIVCLVSRGVYAAQEETEMADVTMYTPESVYASETEQATQPLDMIPLTSDNTSEILSTSSESLPLGVQQQETSNSPLTDEELTMVSRMRPERVDLVRRLTDEDMVKIQALKEGRQKSRVQRQDRDKNGNTEVDQSAVASDQEGSSDAQEAQILLDAKSEYAVNAELYTGIVKALLATQSIAYKRLYDLLYDVARAFKTALNPQQTAKVLELVELFEKSTQSVAAGKNVSPRKAMQSVEAMNKVRTKLLPFTFALQDQSLQWPSKEKMALEMTQLMQMVVDTLKIGNEIAQPANKITPQGTSPEMAPSIDQELTIKSQPKKMAPMDESMVQPVEPIEQAVQPELIESMDESVQAMPIEIVDESATQEEVQSVPVEKNEEEQPSNLGESDF